MGMPGMLTSGWGAMIRLMADALGVELEEIREVYERDFAKEDFACDMPVKAGECGAVGSNSRESSTASSSSWPSTSTDSVSTRRPSGRRLRKLGAAFIARS